MSHIPLIDWNPLSKDVQRDQRRAFDLMRKRCPVAYSEAHQWTLFRHEDIVKVLADYDTYSNCVSKHVSVPNGMDPPEHTVYRNIIKRYFSNDQMEKFEPRCRQVIDDILSKLTVNVETELIEEIALPFAARAQCEFMGWTPTAHNELVIWSQRQHQATRAGDTVKLTELATEFEGFVARMIQNCED